MLCLRIRRRSLVFCSSWLRDIEERDADGCDSEPGALPEDSRWLKGIEERRETGRARGHGAG